jgi:hypothetical protein
LKEPFRNARAVQSKLRLTPDFVWFLLNPDTLGLVETTERTESSGEGLGDRGRGAVEVGASKVEEQSLSCQWEE